MKHLKEIIKKIDFGDIDGLYDPNLLENFIDLGFSKSIIEKDTFFVLGRKGTGKSALYSYIDKIQSEKGILVSNLSFKNFPFEKLLELTDDNFSKPNQYQSIWRNIILSEYAKQIITDETNPIEEIFKELKKYVDYVFGTDLIDLHKKVTKSAEKKGREIGFNKGIFSAKGSNERSSEKEFTESFENISKINERLEYLVSNYLKINGNTQYIVQFDQLDDNYNVYIDNKPYFQSLISLFKTIYDLNQTFRSQRIKVKTVAYLRSDIFYAINAFDSESARWDQFKMNLNWAIINRSDWIRPKLREVINKRIKNSIDIKGNGEPFSIVFNSEKLGLKENNKIVKPFKYMVHRSFHRPRDIIQFCIKVQQQVEDSNSYFFRTIKEAEKEYSLWLLSELENEIAPRIKHTEDLYELLRLMGQRFYSMTDFKKRYSKYSSTINLDAEELLKFLYSLGIIFNVNPRKRMTEVYSIIRNDRSVFNRDILIMTHPGFYNGLYTSKFMKR
jgi:hypothetical protein